MTVTKPVRRITSPQDLDKWIDSDAYNEVVGVAGGSVGRTRERVMWLWS